MQTMITDDDVKKLEKTFATKIDLAVEVTKVKDELRADIQNVEKRFETRFDQVMTGLDKVLVEVQAVRQEQTVHQSQHEDIEKDLAAIKSIPIIAHALKR
jgi:hypothetical protein